jgi:dihydropteroate synthase
MRKRRYWSLPQREIAMGERPLLGAWIPITADAAPDGQRYLDPDRAFARALQLEEQGADFIELAAEQLRPGVKLAGEEEQLHRVIPVLKRLRNKIAIPLAVRTSQAAVAQRAIEHGAEIVFDPSGLTADTGLAKIAADAGAGLILGHMRGAPERWAKQPPPPDAIAALTQDIEAALHRATQAHIESKRLLIDPGLGLGKRREENARILGALASLDRFNTPVAVHLDTPDLLTHEPAATSADAAATAAIAVAGGVYVIVAFDIAALRPLILAADAVYQAQPDPDAMETPEPRSRR